MKIELLLKELKDNNISLALRNGKLLWKLPEGGIDDKLFSLLKDKKAEIKALLEKKDNLKKYLTIGKAAQMESFPLSPAQKRLWSFNQVKDGASVYHIPFAGKLIGELHLDLFEKSFRYLVERHEILRTVLRKDKNHSETRQFILPVNEVAFNIDYLDFSLNQSADQEVKRQLQKMTKAFMDLEKAPLFRTSLIKLAKEEHVFLFVIHHAICDSRSMEIFISELIQTYNKLRHDVEKLETPLRIQYKDYVCWLEEEMQTETYRISENYWLDKFSRPSMPLNLPSIKRRPPVQTFNGNSQRHSYTLEFTDQLKRFSKNNRVRLFTVLMAGIKALLGRYSGQDDITIGTPVSGRIHPDLENQIGLYVNTLAVRTQFKLEDSFQELLREEEQNLLEALEHQAYSFDKLVDKLDLKRNLNRSPLFDVFVAFQDRTKLNIDKGPESVNGLSLKKYDFKKNASQFDLSFYFSEYDDRLELEIQYNTDICEDIFISKLFKHFKELLTVCIADTTIQLNKVNYIPSEEQAKIFEFSNSLKTDYPRDRSIIELFEEQVSLNPESEAVRLEGQNWSYFELDVLATKYACVLRKDYGIMPKDRVVVSLEHGAYLIPVLLAIKKLGAVYVSLDPSTPENRIEYVLEDSQSKLFIDQSFMDDLQVADYNFDNLKLERASYKEADKIEFIIYTSGSTGRPKGIMIKSEGVMNRLNWMWKNYPYSADEVSCAKTSIGFVDHICEIFGPLLKGIPLVLFKKRAVQDTKNFIFSLNQHKVSRIVLVPSLLREMLLYPKLCKEQLQKLKIWTSSGEALKKSDVKNFYSVLQNPEVRLLNIYGSTEVTADATYYDTYAKFNSYKKFELFDLSAKRKIENLISEHAVAKQIIDQPLSELIKDDFFKEVSIKGQFSIEEYLTFIRSRILPNVVNLGHPSFIGHMTGPIPDIIKELNALVVAMNQNQVKIETSSVATLIEKQLIGIFHQLVYNRSEEYYRKYTQDADHALGIVTNGGTMSNIVALSYTLNKLLQAKEGFEGIAKEGLISALQAYDYKKVVLLGSNWCHYSFDKALKILGLGSKAFVELDYEDKTEAQILQEVTDIIYKLKQEKALILGIIGIAGTTESGNVEPLEIIGKIAQQHELHYHVDAAFGGGFLTDDELRQKLNGIELADSVTICAHKQFYVPVGLSICLFEDASHVQHSESNSRYQARKGSYDLGRFTLEGSKDFMSLVLHGAFSILGKEGFGEVIRNNYHSAQIFAKMIREREEFELLYEPDLNIVLYRYLPLRFRTKRDYSDVELESINRLNKQIQQEQFKRGNSFVSYTSVKKKSDVINQVVFRTVFMNPYTTLEHLELLLDEQVSIAYEIENGIRRDAIGINENILIGRPIENVKVYILDDYLNILPIGMVGEICISGDGLAAGYIGAEELDASRFVDNVFSEGERLYRTGDLGRWKEDGNIEFLGRKDNQVKIRGNRVELGEIENILINTESITGAIVMAIEKTDSEEKELAAYFVADKKEKITDLIVILRQSLPDYMLPDYFIQLDGFPLNASGKIDKKALPDPLEAGQTHKYKVVATETYHAGKSRRDLATHSK